MSQKSLTFPGPKYSGPSFVDDLNEILQALASNRAGDTRPVDIQPSEMWVQTVSAASWLVNIWDGTQDLLVATINPVAHTLTFPGGGVAVSATDTSPGNLMAKLSAGANIALTKVNGGDDEALVLAVTGLGGAAALDPGTTAGKLVQLNSSGELPAVSAKNLTDLPVSGSLDLSMMNAILTWRNISKASGAFPGGYLFTFQSAELAGVVNGEWDSYLKGYSNQVLTTGGSGYTANGSWSTGQTAIDRNYALPNGARVERLGAYSTSAQDVTLKIALENSTSSYTIVVTQTFAHTGSGWEYFNLTSPYTVPGTGIFRLGLANSATIPGKISVARSWATGNPGLGTTEFNADTHITPLIGAKYRASATNMTLLTTAITVGTVPNTLRVYFNMRVVDGTILTTDLKFRCSRDGGVTWTEYKSPTTLCHWDAGYTHLDVLDFDLAALASGTSIVVELSTYNLKAMVALALGYVPK